MCCGGGNQVDDDGDENTEKYGKAKQHNKEFKGPIQNRSCTDILCCLLFIVCIAGMLVVSAVGYSYGDPYKLVYPTDSDGKMCGVGDYANKPYLHYFDILQCTKVGVAAIATGCPTPSVCMEACPSTYWVYATEVLKATPTASNFICKNGVTATGVTNVNILPTLISTDKCASYYVPTVDCKYTIS